MKRPLWEALLFATVYSLAAVGLMVVLLTVTALLGLVDVTVMTR